MTINKFKLPDLIRHLAHMNALPYGNRNQHDFQTSNTSSEATYAPRSMVRKTSQLVRSCSKFWDFTIVLD